MTIHESILYPTVRVRAKKTGGSGTVLWSKDIDGEFVTFVLTNHHVISDLITVEKKYKPWLQREAPVETRGTASVEFFEYKHGSRNVGTYSVNADIETYVSEQDMALLRLRSVKPAEFVAKLPPIGKEREIHLLDKVYAVGASLGHPPMVTDGTIAYMDDEIDDYNYWMSTAQIIFGNSGGSMYLADTSEFIGVPSRVAVAAIGWGADVITHMGFFIPFDRVYKWLESEYYHFIFDEGVNYKECEAERKKAKEEQRRFADIQTAHDIGIEQKGQNPERQH